MKSNNNQSFIYNSNSRRKFLSKFGLGAVIAGTLSNHASASNSEQQKQGRSYIWDPIDFGAKGDSRTMNTKAIQKAIDLCSEAGGGIVYLHGGCYISGTVYLKSNVTLHVEAGTTLQASDNLDDFPVTPSKYPSYTGEFVTNKMLIYAEDQSNITICGRGTIDGNGDHWIDGPYFLPSFSVRPRIIHFRGCENIHVRDVTLYNSASWVQSYVMCRNMVIDGIKVDSRENPNMETEYRFEDAPGRNCDGLGLADCQQVRISNCFIISGDDAIVLKSLSPDKACRDITITNCIISSNISGIKIGTETVGAFEDITVSNCSLYDTRGDAISLLTADGARVERICISNISLRYIKGSAIGIRLSTRNRTYRKNAKSNIPCLKDIIIDNIQGTRISYEYGCSIRGIPGNMVENIVLRNINLQFVGGGKASESYRPVPEDEKGYVHARTFGVVPAYGLFIRHAKNIMIDNIQLGFKEEDHRPALICDNVQQLEITGLKASGTSNTPELIRLVNTRDVVLSQSRPTSYVPVFMNIQGDQSDDIRLLNNILKNAGQAVKFEQETMKNIVTEYGTIK